MRVFRWLVENWYDRNRERIFARTEGDPKIAHEMFVERAIWVDEYGLSGLLLDCPENRKSPGFEISNAAGFNKDGRIPPDFLWHLGFDRNVIGTVTAESWIGNQRPSIVRYAKTNSLVNWEGLPGAGVVRVGENISAYGDCKVPTTVNFMSTPGKMGDELLDDLEYTVLYLGEFGWIDRFELNISCPNTHDSGGGLDARQEYQENLAAMLDVVSNSLGGRELGLKVSPDLDHGGVKDILDVVEGRSYVRNIVCTNTTTNRDVRYINPPLGKGGASGDAVYPSARSAQDMFCQELDERRSNLDLIAVGGISSAKRAMERTQGYGGRVKGIQLYTPLIFKGPRLLRELRGADGS